MPPCRALIVACLLLIACCSLCIAQDSCGIIWDEPILLSDTIHDAHSPKIALSGDDTIHITWWSVARFGTSDVRLPYCLSTDGGGSIQGPMELLQDSVAFPGYANSPKIAAWHSNVYVFFQGSTASDTPIRMVKSTTGGSTWQYPVDISADTTGPPPLSPTVLGDTIALIYERFGMVPSTILRSTNGGITWSRSNEALSYYPRVALSNGGVLHLVHSIESAISRETEYRRSHDLGDTWMQTEVISTVDAHHSLDLAIAAEDTLLVAAWRDEKYGCLGPLGCSIITKKGMSRSDSTVWEEERAVTDAPNGFAPSPSIKKKRIAVGWVADLPAEVYHASVRVTGEGDTAWCSLTDLTPTTDYKVTGIDAAISAKAVHVVWEQNVAPSPSTFRVFYRRGRFTSTGVDESPEQPLAALLAQNYPNPFNASTTIVYRVGSPASAATPELVSLKVYDVLGREVASLVNGKKEQGEHSVDWNAGEMPSGIYYYRLISGNRVETRKAILLK